MSINIGLQRGLLTKHLFNQAILYQAGGFAFDLKLRWHHEKHAHVWSHPIFSLFRSARRNKKAATKVIEWSGRRSEGGIVLLGRLIHTRFTADWTSGRSIGRRMIYGLPRSLLLLSCPSSILPASLFTLDSTICASSHSFLLVAWTTTGLGLNSIALLKSQQTFSTDFSTEFLVLQGVPHCTINPLLKSLL